MKKIIIAVVLVTGMFGATATVADAHPHHGHRHCTSWGHHHHGCRHWG